MILMACADVFDAINNNAPTLVVGSRLDTAQQNSTIDTVPTLIVLAYKESSFVSDAAGPTNDLGLFQFTPGTADDTQDRVVANWVTNAIPNLPAGARFVNYRSDPAASAFCAWAYILDRIAANGNDLVRGLNSYNPGEANYGQKIVNGVTALRVAAGLAPGAPTDLLGLRLALQNNCAAIKAALDPVVHA